MGSTPDRVGMKSILDRVWYGEHAGQELVYGASRTGLV